jgi:hypothetical protein
MENSKLLHDRRMSTQLSVSFLMHSNFLQMIFFIGEVVSACTEEEYITDDNLDIKKVKSFVLTMPDNRYWQIGKHIGNAGKDGNDLIEDH